MTLEMKLSLSIMAALALSATARVAPCVGLVGIGRHAPSARRRFR